MRSVNNVIGWIYQDKLLLQGTLIKKQHLKHSVFRSYFAKHTTKRKVMEISVGEQTQSIQTDEKGNFTVSFGQLSTQDFVVSIVVDNRTTTLDRKDFYALNPGDQVLISDIDDTILKSHTLYPIKQLINSLRPVKTRKTIPNTQKFIQQMSRNGCHTIYVSNSSMNLKTYLLSFLDNNGFPKGPLLLNDFQNVWTLIVDKLKGKKHIIDYKKDRINRIMNFLEGCVFGLLGDNSQQDPEVFLTLNKLHKKKITLTAVRKAVLTSTAKIESAYDDAGIPLILFDDTDDIDQLMNESTQEL